MKDKARENQRAFGYDFSESTVEKILLADAKY
jgi:hypothetical protein